MKLSLILFSPAKGGVRENLLSGGITSVGIVQGLRDNQNGLGSVINLRIFFLLL
jgi:hypothetical protein